MSEDSSFVNSGTLSSYDIQSLTGLEIRDAAKMAKRMYSAC